MPTVRIATADDHPIFSDGLRRVLTAEPGFEVVGQATTCIDTVRLVQHLAPDVLLLDYAMRDCTALDVLRALGESPTRVVLLTAAIGRQDVITALRLGARGVVLKESPTTVLTQCIRAVMAGEYWFGPERIPDLVAALRQLEPRAPLPAESLTPRELRIVAAIVEGATNRDVAGQLGVTEQTVKNHLSHIFDKVGVSNRLELALFAIHHNLLNRHP